MTKNLLMPDDRIRQMDKKIINFQTLKAGWHFGEGIPPGSDAIHKALKLNSSLSAVGFKKTNAFPGVNGEIQVTAYHQSIYLEMTIEPDGLITFVYEDGDQEVEYRQMLLDEVI